MVATGYLEGDRIVIKDEAEGNRLYNKGYHGTPSRDGLYLSLLEAILLVELGRLEVVCGGSCGFEGSDLEGLMTRAVGTEDRFELRYSVYRDLRDRGYVAKQATVRTHDLDLYPRGKGPGKGIRPTRVICLSERDPFLAEDLWSLAADAAGGSSPYVLAVMDEEGDITHYEMNILQPKGSDSFRGPRNVEAVMFEDKVLVMDEKAEALHGKGNFGKMVGKNLQLSLLETAYLMAEGVLSLRNAATKRLINSNTFMKRAVKAQPDLRNRLRTYADLRSRKMVVKTGFKYGTHFRVYESDPDGTHARFLVHVVPSDFSSTWPEVSRAIRLAHGVRKDLVLARDTGKVPSYLYLARTKL